MPKLPPSQSQVTSPVRATKPMEIVQSRCKVCVSKYRRIIDRELILGTPYAEIARVYGVDRRSVSGHSKKHLSISNSAAKKLVEREIAAYNANIEDGVKAVMNRRLVLEEVVQKAREGIHDGTIAVEVRDAIAAVDKLEKLNISTSELEVEEMRTQLRAFIDAIQEVAGKEMWDQIYLKTKEILEGSDSEMKELPSGSSKK